MFEGKIKAKLLKDIVGAAAAVVDEAKLNITPTGFILNAVDPANVAMVSLKLSKDSFEEYETKEATVIGLDMSKLNDILGFGTDEISLRLDTMQSKMHIDVSNMKYSMSLLDPESLRREPKALALEFSATAAMKQVDFKQGLKIAEKVGDRVTIGISDGAFWMKAESDMDSMEWKLLGDQVALSGDGVSSMYSLDYVLALAKGSSPADDVTVLLGNNYPLKLCFELEGNEVSYLLAPRIEAE